VVNPADVHGKCLAMMAWGKKADGKDDVAVFTGTAEWDGSRLLIRRGHGDPPVEVQDEWLARIEPVDPSLRAELLGAEYCFHVTSGPLPRGEDMSAYRDTGLTWPPDENAS
jgi:hypothetical protein